MGYFSKGFSELSFFNLYKENIKTLYERKKKDDKNSMYFKFNVDEQINGSVQFYNNKDIIIINTGTIAEIHKMFTMFMCNKGILPIIGDIRKEFNINYQNFGYRFDENKLQLLFTNEPRCDVRRQASIVLSSIAVRFIIEHELVHVFNGHSEYAADKVEAFRFYMCSSNDNNNIDELSLKAIEMDADQVAMNGIMDAMIDAYEKFEMLEMLKTTLKQKKDIFMIYTFSITALFLLLEKRYKTEKEEKKELIPPIVRFIFNLSAGDNFIKNYYSDKKMDETITLDEIEKLQSLGIKLAQVAFNHVYNENIIIEDAIEYYSREINEFSEIQKEWEAMVIKLDKYKRQPLFSRGGIKGGQQ